MAAGLDIGFELDRRWHSLRGEMEQSKKPALLALGEILADSGIAYAIIGGVALQVHQQEPRTTLDIDLAILRRDALPRASLQARGFRPTGSFPNSENWIGPGETPVQFTDDPALAGAVQRATSVVLDGVPLRFIGKIDLLHEKLRAGADPARRRSKRLQDLADAQALLEADGSLLQHLTQRERELLATLPP